MNKKNDKVPANKRKLNKTEKKHPDDSGQAAPTVAVEVPANRQKLTKVQERHPDDPGEDAPTEHVDILANKRKPNKDKKNILTVQERQIIMRLKKLL